MQLCCNTHIAIHLEISLLLFIPQYLAAKSAAETASRLEGMVAEGNIKDAPL